MQCEKCKLKRATVFFAELDRTRHALCPACAGEAKKDTVNAENGIFATYTPVTYMYELVHNSNRIYYNKYADTASLICPTCKTDINDVLASGKMGCTQCYKVFTGSIQFSDFKQPTYSIFNSKIPKRFAIRKETEKIIESLRQKLNIAIQGENFEYAAKLRDEIKALGIAQKGI